MAKHIERPEHCPPGQHDFVWDEEENKNRMDGGAYHKCTKCGGLARSPDDRESFWQTISRYEDESQEFLKEGLRAIGDDFDMGDGFADEILGYPENEEQG